MTRLLLKLCLCMMSLQAPKKQFLQITLNLEQPQTRTKRRRRSHCFLKGCNVLCKEENTSNQVNVVVTNLISEQVVYWLL